jgi:hypothetical protein
MTGDETDDKYLLDADEDVADAYDDDDWEDDDDFDDEDELKR